MYYDLNIRLSPDIGYIKKGNNNNIIGDWLIALGRINEAFEMFRQAIKFNKDQHQYINRGFNVKY